VTFLFALPGSGIRDRGQDTTGKHFAYSNIGYQIMGYRWRKSRGKSSAEMFANEFSSRLA